MPVAKRKTNSAPKIIKNEPAIEPKGYESIVNDDRITPINSLVSYIEGAPWTVDYYSQYITKHNDLREVDPNQPNAFQQYQKIIGFEIRVTAPLSSTYDSEKAITQVTGEGNLYPVIIPNVADYFVTDTNDNKKAIFKIVNVERKSFNKESSYAVDYELVGYIDVLAELFNSLEEKTIRSFYFSKERLIDNLQPLLKEEEYKLTIDLNKTFHELIKYYFDNFFNRRYMTFVLPGQEYAIYDTYLTNHILKMVSIDIDHRCLDVRQLTTDNDPFLSQAQFWDALQRRDFDLLSYCNKNMGIVSRSAFYDNTYIVGARFAMIDYFIYPVSVDETVRLNDDQDKLTFSNTDLIKTVSYSNQMLNAIENTYTTSTKVLQLIKDFDLNGTYVLSQDFYQNNGNMSVLEILVKDYMQGNSLDLKMLTTLVGRYRKWPRLEQFYYGPIILTLLTEKNRSLYT